MFPELTPRDPSGPCLLGFVKLLQASGAFRRLKRSSCGLFENLQYLPSENVLAPVHSILHDFKGSRDLLNAPSGLFGDLSWEVRVVCLSVTAGLQIFHCCFFLTWSSVFCAFSCFVITCWTLSGPEEAILSRSAGTRFLTHHDHPYSLVFTQHLLLCRTHVALVSEVPRLRSQLHFHLAC